MLHGWCVDYGNNRPTYDFSRQTLNKIGLKGIFLFIRKNGYFKGILSKLSYCMPKVSTPLFFLNNFVVKLCQNR